MSCIKSCWWQEGGLCYVEPCERNSDGRSKTACEGMCDKYQSKRKALTSVIPDDMLVITSELSPEDEKKIPELEKIRRIQAEIRNGKH